MDLSWYKGKRVLVTGHTGFKGAWLCRILRGAGAAVTGYALPPPKGPNLFCLGNAADGVTGVTGDVRDFAALQAAYNAAAPEVVFHLAAQPIVRTGYEDPVGTYATNAMGTVHLLECVRQGGGAPSVVNVTTDKVYRNNEWERGYSEDDVLDGYDPYANSKSVSELVSAAYRRSFLRQAGAPLSTARAGNVIGGGDFAGRRILPDCVRAAQSGAAVAVRSPASIRPYQHVLEPLAAYLVLAQKQAQNPALCGAYNIGPNDDSCVTTRELVELFCKSWGGGQSWQATDDPGPHEATFLKLDNTLAKQALGIFPRWDIEKAVDKTVQWYKAWLAGGDLPELMDAQIAEYLEMW